MLIFQERTKLKKKCETTSIIKPGVLEIIGASVRDMFRSLASTAGYLYAPNHEEFFLYPWSLADGILTILNSYFIF